MDSASFVTPIDVSALIALADSRELTERLAREVLEDVIGGAGTSTELVASRGLKVLGRRRQHRSDR